MNWADWLGWGWLGTVVLTTLLAGSQGLGITRMSIPYLLGSAFTPSRDRAKILGFALHMLNGWGFALVYCYFFELLGEATALAGALLGLVHAAFVLVVAMPLFPSLHPRMASEQQGPTVVRQLEPPGMLALHYGVRTPISIVVAHVVFGVILGAFYRVV